MSSVCSARMVMIFFALSGHNTLAIFIAAFVVSPVATNTGTDISRHWEMNFSAPFLTGLSIIKVP